MQHPDITRIEKFGCINEPDESEVRCPVCGKLCERFFKSDGDVLGCDRCIEEEYVI